jgi:hypothetical protein
VFYFVHCYMFFWKEMYMEGEYWSKGPSTI